MGKILYSELHQRALESANRLRGSLAELVDILQEVDEKKVFRAYGRKSLHEYAVQELRLSDDIAYTLIHLARISLLLPEVKRSLKQGRLTISNAGTVLPILKREIKEGRIEEARNWLKKAKTFSKRELENAVVERDPKLLVRDRAEPMGRGRVKLIFGISEDIEKKLVRVKELVSQQRREPVALEDVFESLIDEFLYRFDPEEKAKRMRRKKVVPGQKKKGPISNTLKHLVVKKLGHRCCFVDPNTKKRCEERKWLDFHHKVPRFLGGEDSLENLTILCRAHHQLVHEQARWSREAG